MKTSFPKDRIKAVLLENVHERAAEMLETEGYQVERLPGTLEADEIIERASDAHLIGIRSRTQITEKILAEAGRLLAVGCFCIGTDQVDLAAARARGVPVFNSPFSNTRSVAELTIAEIIALHRRLFDKSRRMHEGLWDKSASGAHEIRGRTLGIVGYGHIGSQLSVMAEAMGMRVIFHDILPKLPLGNAQQVASLEVLLKEADVVSLHVPATRQTENLIGPSELDRMRPGSFIVNNARGKIVDLDALAERMAAGHIAGAATDVFPEEPGSRGDPFECALCGMDNVILTPHIGGSTQEAQANIGADVATKLLKFVNVGSTTGAVNVPEVELPSQPPPEGEASTGAPDRPHRVLHFHKNRPGVLSQINKLVADLGVNVISQYLRTYEDVGYVVLDVGATEADRLTRELRDVPETIRVRVLW